MVFKTILALLIAAVFFANCASRQTQKGNQESDKVKGTITIDGKSENLGYTYARRIKSKDVGSKNSEYLALVSANKPIPEHELSNLLENFKAYEQEQDFSNDKSVNGLLFIIRKGLALTTKNNALIKSASYEGRVIKAGRAYSEGRQLFKEFSMNKSVMKGKALNDYSPYSSNAESESALADGKSTKYKYSVEFEATAKGEPFYKEAEGAVPPDLTLLLSKQGTAEGLLTVNGITINLKYAYAMRIRQFFDEPEEDINVLVTDQVVPEDVLRNMFYRGGFYPKEGKVQGILLVFPTYDTQSLGANIFHKSIDGGMIGFGSSKFENISITKDAITGRTSYAAAGKNSYNWTVSFEIPFRR